MSLLDPMDRARERVLKTCVMCVSLGLCSLEVGYSDAWI